MRAFSSAMAPFRLSHPAADEMTTVERVNERANAAMDRYARGDDSAFADVFDAVGPRVHAYLMRQTGNPTVTDDLLQQTLLQMHRRRGTYAAGFPVLPWAFAIARRLYID